ncbi:hypothetical protein N0V90_000751 [Kalmusia sp. IMI 367209]|nr:hypothetical protein N0V90_000751 [Kalmusia sp. IMI 367209]
MAVAEAAQATQLAPPDTDYDEAQCIAALAQLERLKQQLDDLRLTLPRVVEPFHMPTGPPMYQAFKNNLTKSVRDMKTFRAQWQSQDIQSVLEHAKKSAAANPDLSAGAQVHQYGWVEKEEREKEAAKKEGEGKEKVEDVRVHITKEERENIVAEWRKTHPTIKMEANDEGRELLEILGADE